jgi:hypothetical protein
LIFSTFQFRHKFFYKKWRDFGEMRVPKKWQEMEFH